ncbi:hypothetical protein HELRODRAFT_158433 [Helobdella robusta]|uniref:FAM234A/B beta-propeller domain-containing protein n=1 Tax=Helobdella robusta TaxID=6412 RepID=T1EMS3_HELRO|nr:hypothetical protein HELRODRAFT_158433 [Helobdella robusta]ESO12029.1 hypothetical protein HELRODRAFT_158433 [Helobdella robusta]
MEANFEDCKESYNYENICLGGMIVLNGLNGEELWRHFFTNEIYSLNCNQDLNGDFVNDCIAAGRSGTLEAVNLVNGESLWTFTNSLSRDERMNLYTAQFIGDIDGDFVDDLVNIHGGNPLAFKDSNRISGKIVVLSGRSGVVLIETTVPDQKESYYSPILQTFKNNQKLIFGTGGETQHGSLWILSIKDLLTKNVSQAKQIYVAKHKGIMTPPIMIDLNGDLIEDIVFCDFNSTVLALDGDTYEKIWSFAFQDSETYSLVPSTDMLFSHCLVVKYFTDLRHCY